MDITEIIKQEREEDKKLEEEQQMPQPKYMTIPEDADFLSDIDELTHQLHKNLVNLYSNPAAATDELIKRNGSMLAMLDKYIDTRKNIYMLPKVKLFI